MSNMKLENVLSMKGGNGDASYANNSQAQAKHLQSMLHLLKEALDGISLNSTQVPFVIADLGCSSGVNTINTVDLIAKHIVKRYKESGSDPPEFSAFFSDLPSNDFNTLFQLIPPYATATMEDCLSSKCLARSYFAAGVPGSFYRRLFPARSIDFFNSAFSLHWLSEVPESVVDKKSTAYNEGKIFIHGAKESTANEYRKEFKRGLSEFLRSRSMELKRGGSMFLAFLGRPSLDPTDQGGVGILFGTHFQDAWDDLVLQGLISSEKRDSFNIPVYASTLQEFKEVVEDEGSFAINKLQLFKGGSPLVVDNLDDADDIGRALVATCRSVSGVLVESHIGLKLSNQLFSILETRAKIHAKDLLEHLQFHHVVASLSCIDT